MGRGTSVRDALPLAELAQPVAVYARDLFRAPRSLHSYIHKVEDPFSPSRYIQRLTPVEDRTSTWDTYGFSPEAKTIIESNLFVINSMGNTEYEGGWVPNAFNALLDRQSTYVEGVMEIALPKVDVYATSLPWDLYKDKVAYKAALEALRHAQGDGLASVYFYCHKAHKRSVAAALRAYATNDFQLRRSKYNLKNSIRLSKALRAYAAGTSLQYEAVAGLDLGNCYFYSVDPTHFRKCVDFFKGTPIVVPPGTPLPSW